MECSFYVSTPISELPLEMVNVHVITRNKSDGPDDKPQIKTAIYYNHDGIDWLIDNSFEDTYVESWLKPVELSSIIEEHTELLKNEIVRVKEERNEYR